MPKAQAVEPLSNSNIKELTNRYLALVAEKKEAADAIKDLMTEVKAKGITTKAFKAAAKEIDEQTDINFKEEVNVIIEAHGQQRLFA